MSRVRGTAGPGVLGPGHDECVIRVEGIPSFMAQVRASRWVAHERVVYVRLERHYGARCSCARTSCKRSRPATEVLIRGGRPCSLRSARRHYLRTGYQTSRRNAPPFHRLWDDHPQSTPPPRTCAPCSPNSSHLEPRRDGLTALYTAD